MGHRLLPHLLCLTLAACAAPATPQAAGPFTLERGQGVELAPGLSLRFDAVDDSRCPGGVQCIWAGKLDYRFSIRRAGAALDSFTLSPGQPSATPAALDGRRIVLDQSSIPAPAAPGVALAYRATLTILPPTP